MPIVVSAIGQLASADSHAVIVSVFHSTLSRVVRLPLSLVVRLPSDRRFRCSPVVNSGGQ